MWEEAASHLTSVKDDLERGGDAEQHNLIALSNLWLVASLLYYERSQSCMPDEVFDALSAYLLEHREEMGNVYHVDDYFPADALEAGTGYHMVKRFPVAIYNIAFYFDRGAS